MLSISEPVHGAVLSRRHGEQTEAGLRIAVRGQAPLRDRVTVNGAEADRAGDTFCAQIVLAERETDIVAVSTGAAGRQEHRVRVVWDRHSKPRYRFSIDDNSFFLRDIAQQQYGSPFDCFYLDILRKLNEKYGAKFVLNIYYTTGEDFSLPEFPDRYKGEWADNADWLKLSFHAYANLPDRPYQYATAEKLAADFDRVANEILRFAGEQTWSPPTVIHWGMVQPNALPVLAERGVTVLSGFFSGRSSGFDVHYFLDERRCEHIMRNDVLKDFETGIVFSKVDIVCNNTPLDQVVPTLEPLTRDPNRAEIMDLFTHEQYFWPFYKNHKPDHAARLDAAIRFVTEQSYEPVWFHEGFLGVAD
ncbi:MAG: hypothetical protein JXR37_33610 [Kiritimatiellae bacterium]|nr:hypothetical protein [Kiritimatiellia bacterium]